MGTYGKRQVKRAGTVVGSYDYRFDGAKSQLRMGLFNNFTDKGQGITAEAYRHAVKTMKAKTIVTNLTLDNLLPKAAKTTEEVIKALRKSNNSHYRHGYKYLTSKGYVLECIDGVLVYTLK